MKNKTIFATIFLSMILISAFFVVAQTPNCNNIITSQNTQDFLNEISSINSNLGSCNVAVPGVLGTFVGNGNTQVDVSMTSGSTETFYLTISNKQVTSITSGAPTKANYLVSLDEDTMDSILSASNPLNEILLQYSNGKITLKGGNFWSSFKLFFGKMFISFSSTQQTTTTTAGEGKPDNCDETYLPGHRDYADNKELWDSYSSDTDGVCQSQFGKGTPSPCAHTIQLSINGNPYYLCWYNN